MSQANRKYTNNIEENARDKFCTTFSEQIFLPNYSGNGQIMRYISRTYQWLQIFPPHPTDPQNYQYAITTKFSNLLQISVIRLE